MRALEARQSAQGEAWDRQLAEMRASLHARELAAEAAHGQAWCVPPPPPSPHTSFFSLSY